MDIINSSCNGRIVCVCVLRVCLSVCHPFPALSVLHSRITRLDFIALGTWPPTLHLPLGAACRWGLGVEHCNSPTCTAGTLLVMVVTEITV